MSELLRGYVLPGATWPDPIDLLSALLIWEELEVEGWGSSSPAGEDDLVYPALVEAGLLQPYASHIEIDLFVDPSIPAAETDAERSARAEENGVLFADGLIDVVADGLKEARERGLAPLALEELTELALAMPVPDPGAPAAQATAIRVATAGVRVNGRTRVEDLLRFRDRNRRLMGRYRAVLGDLAASLETDDPRRAAEHAQATLANRLEPALGDMTDALSRSRVLFTLEAVLGATTVSLAPLDPATLAAATGVLAVRTLKYAFDRERVVREHPLGLLFRARGEFGAQPGAPAPTIDDPHAVLRKIVASRYRTFFGNLREHR
jgi:hypothetical protein